MQTQDTAFAAVKPGSGFLRKNRQGESFFSIVTPDGIALRIHPAKRGFPPHDPRSRVGLYVDDEPVDYPRCEPQTVEAAYRFGVGYGRYVRAMRRMTAYLDGLTSTAGEGR